MTEPLESGPVRRAAPAPTRPAGEEWCAHTEEVSWLSRPVRQPWAPAYDRLEASDDWLLGYTEVRFDMVPRLPGALGRDLVRASTLVLGNGAFVARAGTPLTEEWHAEQNRRLDEWLPVLERHPGDWARTPATRSRGRACRATSRDRCA